MDEILPPAPVRSEIDDRDFDGGGHRGGADPGVVQLPPARSATGEIVKEVLEESAQEAGEISAGDAGFTHAMSENEGVEHRAPDWQGWANWLRQDGQGMAGYRAGSPEAKPVDLAASDPDESPKKITGICPEIETGRNQMPEMPETSGHLANSMESHDVTESNARQMPVDSAASYPDESEPNWGGLDAAESTGLSFTEFDQSTGWDELWRIEKDGNWYRWRLRFTEHRVSRTIGKNADVKRLLRKRPGKGRHQESRQDADRLRRRAELAAIGLRANSERRVKSKDNTGIDQRRNSGLGDSDTQREQVSDVSELAQRDRVQGVPDVEWPAFIE